ncbi:hypothetical protein [Nocardia sputorum]|uniref:hypothetical protein n=1 Tax=Nocardia sputorum TaxID=2984338 RepID=UPI002490083A|nr:hypothetical protein [Nocardia sputorum]
MSVTVKRTWSNELVEIGMIEILSDQPAPSRRQDREVLPVRISAPGTDEDRAGLRDYSRNAVAGAPQGSPAVAVPLREEDGELFLQCGTDNGLKFGSPVFRAAQSLAARQLQDVLLVLATDRLPDAAGQHTPLRSW